jgi:hypothetical protein
LVAASRAPDHGFSLLECRVHLRTEAAKTQKFYWKLLDCRLQQPIGRCDIIARVTRYLFTSTKGQNTMAVNLMDLVKTALAGSVSDQLGSAVGLDKKQTASALDAVVPMLLGGLMKKASTPSGASELSNVLRQQDTSLLDNLGGLLGGGSSSVTDMISMGTKLLPSILGSTQSGIISALVRMLGINEKTIGSLLGIVAPIVMSIVGKQAKASGGFDVSSLTNLLGGQKDFLAKATPSELKGVMGLTDSIGSAVNKTVDAARNVPTPSSNPLQWLLPLIALAVLGYLGYSFLFNKPAENKPVTSTPTPSIPAPSLPSVTVPDLTDLKKSLTSNFEGLAGVLEGITDEATAKSSLGKIESAAKAYTDLGVDKLPAVAQTGLVTFLKPYLARLTEILDKVYLIPGVKEVIDPALGPMLKAVKAIGA